MSVSLAAADRLWTPSDLAKAIGEDDDWRRYEIVDGLLTVSPLPTRVHVTVSPLPTRVHGRLVMRVGAAVLAVVPDDLDVLGATMIDLHPSYRITDVTVIRSGAYDDPSTLTRANDVVIAIEIESPSSITTDRVTKPAQYAAAGIVHFWRLETDPLRLNVYRLGDGVYELSGSWGEDETAVITDPFAVTIDLASLLP